MLSNAGLDPPDLTGTMSLSPETVEETAAKIAESPQRSTSELSSKETGHRRSTTPSTPVGLTQLFCSTPGRSEAGMPQPAMQSQHHHHPISDLTPVISNSNATYVDSQVPFVARPGMPGLSEGGLYSSAAVALVADGGESSSARRLRQRPARMPMPRSGGLPPAKRSSFDKGSGGSSDDAEALASKVPTPLLRLGSVNSSDSSLQGEHLRSPLTSAMEGVGGMFSLEERLVMPSYSMYSDDESSADTSGNGNANIFQQKEMPPINGLSPIQLKADRKFSSFQGASQYKRAVGENEVAPQTRLETIPGDGPPASPIKGEQPMLATMHNGDQKNQYQPMLRGQHGVKELAKSEELDAIFKEPRRQQPPHLVSPYTVSEDVKGGGPVMIVDQQQLQQPMSLSYLPLEEEDEEGVTAVIPPPYPVESQWSIPSIRLANQVDQSGSRSMLDSYNYSYGDISEYTEDEGASLGSESYYSFLDDDDNASLGSKSSLDASSRKRKSRLATLQFLKKESIDRLSREGSASSEAMEVAQSNSFLERVGGISIEDVAPVAEATTVVANDINISSPPSMMVPPTLPRCDNHAKTQPSLLGVNIPANDEGATDVLAGIPAAEPRSRKSRYRNGVRSRRKEGAAEEWIRDLRGKSDGVQLIAESASSKFMTGDGATIAVGGGHSQVDGVGGAVGSNVPDVSKALGMPHPLCRSSTIEAGPLTVHRSVFQSTANGDNATRLGSNNSIALTSSGSGD